jgi:hypothetical protein
LHYTATSKWASTCAWPIKISWRAWSCASLTGGDGLALAALATFGIRLSSDRDRLKCQRLHADDPPNAGSTKGVDELDAAMNDLDRLLKP